MLQFRTQGFNGYSVKYSPFFDSRIAVASAANFGLVGNGRLYILGLTPQGILPEKIFDTQDSLYDTAWSEQHENQIVTASGDGTIKLFDISLDNFPVQSWSEHAREVFSVHWNLVSKDTFLSSSWDGTVKIWNPLAPESVTTIPTHSCTYSAQFSPHSPWVGSCVSSDSHLRIFDLRTPANAANHVVATIPIHAPGIGLPPGHLPGATAQPSECLTHDWNKYRDGVIATAGVDKIIRVFDIRAPQRGPVVALEGHEYAIRRISWSPHLSDLLLSASYDMTCRVWSDGSREVGAQQPGGGAMNAVISAQPSSGPRRQMGVMSRHTEFATGVDWCLFGAEGWCASCGWDEQLMVWDAKAVMVN